MNGVASFWRKIVHVSEKIMSADKYAGIYSQQMEAVVYILCYNNNILLITNS